MPPAPLPPDELTRLRELHSFGILDTAPAQSYQGIVERLAQECETPMAAISLIASDRHWLKASVGIVAREGPRSAAFCAYTIHHEEPMIVEDATADPRFADNPLVTGERHIRFYAGMPLISDQGARIGALCAIDTRPRLLSRPQLRRLRWLAGRTMILFNIHKAVEQVAFRSAPRSSA